MARYIEADALSTYFDTLAKHAEMEGLHNHAHLYKRCLQLVDDAHTADVVPKSEVAKIFEDIEENYADFLFDGHRNILVLTEKDFAELKKKYTVGADE